MNGIPTSTSAENTRQQRLNEEAAAWLLQLETEDTAECRARFRKWLEESAEHVLVFLQTSATYRGLDTLSNCGIDLTALVREVAAENSTNVIAISLSNQAEVRAADLAKTIKRSQRRRRLAGIAASLGGSFVLYVVGSAIVSAPTYTTEIGEQRSVKLPDGSIMSLNTRSRAKIHFSKSERQINLLDGEALFSVAQDRGRPFRVVTNNAVVQALGTRFNVYRHRGETTISVLQGTVQISGETQLRASTAESTKIEADRARPQGGSSPTSASPPAHENAGAYAIQPALRLTAGEQASVASDGHIEKQRETHASRVLAWQQRKLEFNHATLQEVAEEFNRYNERQIRIEDPSVRKSILNGVFNADEPEALLKFLAREPGLTVQRVGNAAIVRRATVSKPH